MPGLSPSIQTDKFFDVFAEQIGFEVHGIADFTLAERSNFVSVRNDPDAEFFFLYARNREADAFDHARFLDNSSKHAGKLELKRKRVEPCFGKLWHWFGGVVARRHRNSQPGRSSYFGDSAIRAVKKRSGPIFRHSRS